jgi:hypothetical protein
LNIQKILSNQPWDLVEQIEPVIFSKDHRYWAELRERLEMLKKDRKLNLNIHI